MSSVLAELIEEGLLIYREGPAGPEYALTPAGLDKAIELLENSQQARDYFRERRMDRATGEGRR